MKSLKPLLQIFVYLLVFYFIFRILSKNWSEVKSTIEHLNYWWVALSMAVMTVTLASQSYNWHLFIKNSHQSISFRESFSSFFKSVLTRYLPGGVWVFFARVYVTTKFGLSKAQVLFLIAVESAISVMSGCIIFLLTHPPIENSVYLVVLFVVLIGVALLFLLKPDLLLFYIKKIFKKDLAIVPLPLSTTLITTGLSVIQWLLFGLSLSFLANALPGAPTHHLFSFTGMFAASWVIGFIIIFIPSGIGVRESFLIVFLGTLMPLPIATILAILSRIIGVLAELANFLISLSIKLNPLSGNEKLVSSSDQLSPPTS